MEHEPPQVSDEGIDEPTPFRGIPMTIDIDSAEALGIKVSPRVKELFGNGRVWDSADVRALVRLARQIENSGLSVLDQPDNLVNDPPDASSSQSPSADIPPTSQS
ncbi:MAG: hypothetical protein HYV40_02995 [Candidatus Levybacteria bacterium]|nr:hypothetical protein [Candidatus Levybacteria bacterium]